MSLPARIACFIAALLFSAGALAQGAAALNDRRKLRRLRLRAEGTLDDDGPFDRIFAKAGR